MNGSQTLKKEISFIAKSPRLFYFCFGFCFTFTDTTSGSFICKHELRKAGFPLSIWIIGEFTHRDFLSKKLSFSPFRLMLFFRWAVRLFYADTFLKDRIMKLNVADTHFFSGHHSNPLSTRNVLGNFLGPPPGAWVVGSYTNTKNQIPKIVYICFEVIYCCIDPRDPDLIKEQIFHVQFGARNYSRS